MKKTSKSNVFQALRGLRCLLWLCQVLASFTQALADGPPLKRGLNLLFELQAGALKLHMGQHVVELKGKALPEALLAVYLDAKPVAPEFKQQVFKGVSQSRSSSSSSPHSSIVIVMAIENLIVI